MTDEQAQNLDPLAELAEIESSEEFAELVERRPELLSDEMLGALEPLRGALAGPSLELVVSLLSEARADPLEAFRQYRERVEGIQPRLDEFEESYHRFETALAEGRPDDAIPDGEVALGIAIEMGLPVPVLAVHHMLGKALAACQRGNRSENIDRAIEHLEAAGPLAFTDDIRASIRSDLGALWGRRIAGDPSENHAIAMALTRQAIVDLGSSDNGELRATIEGNLSYGLAEGPGKNAEAAVREALELARQALDGADFAEAPDQWAQCQINLAAALAAGLKFDHSTSAEVVEAYLEAADRADELDQRWLAGFALKSAARILRYWSRQPAVDLPTAVEYLDRAIELIGDRNDLVLGQSFSQRGDIQWMLGDRRDAARSLEEAINLLPMSTSPTDRRDAASRLAGLRTELGEYQEAVAAFDLAIEAAEVAFQARLQRAGREAETGSAARLYRWASAVYHRQGLEEKAVVALETGRTRELKRRLEPTATLLDELGDVPAGLREAYLEASERLRAEPLRAADNEASADLGRVLEEIRSTPGHEAFATAPRLDDIAAAALQDWPLLYVNPTPMGTCFLAVSADGAILSRFEPGTSSSDVWRELVLKDISDSDQTPDPESYLNCAAGPGDMPTMHRALERLLPWLGERFGQPIIELTAELGVENLTLIPCGPLCLAPLSAAVLPGDGSDFLLDQLGLRLAPSAELLAACQGRSGRNHDRSLVALAGPKLPGAEPECHSIAAGFATATVLAGAAADSAALAAKAPDASHIHLACHGRGGLSDFSDAAIKLADGWVSADQLTTLGLRADLVVASACQTAVAQTGDLGDESYSLASALLGAGAACAIASLWKVPDSATALLMARFYEELSQEPAVPEALRRAQLWIRQASVDDVEAFGDEHSELSALVRQLRRPGTVGSDKPFARTPVAWAAFSAYGA